MAGEREWTQDGNSDFQAGKKSIRNVKYVGKCKILAYFYAFYSLNYLNDVKSY